MALLLPGPPLGDHNAQEKFDTISREWPNRAVGVFSAYRSAALSLATAGTVVFDAEFYDVSSWYDTTTGRYQPKIPCYARLSWMVYVSTALVVDNYVVAYLRKNGVGYASGTFMNYRTAAAGAASNGTCNMVFNGTTDYADVRLDHNNGGNVALVTGTPPVFTYFTGEMIAP